MATGVVRFYAIEKGYGFISPDEGASDLFVHSSCLGNGVIKLMPAQRVSFDVLEHSKGPRAVNVRVIG